MSRRENSISVPFAFNQLKFSLKTKTLSYYVILTCLFLTNHHALATPLETDFSWGGAAYTPNPTTGEWLPTEGGFFWHSAVEIPSNGPYSYSTYPTGLTKLSDGSYLLSGQVKEVNSATRSFLERFSSNGTSLEFIDTHDPNSLVSQGGALSEETFGGKPPLSRPVQSSDGSIFWPVLEQGSYPSTICNLYRLTADINSVISRFVFSEKRDGGTYLNPGSYNGIKSFDARILMSGPNGSVYTYVDTSPKGIARLTANGSFDTTFEGDGFVSFTTLTGKVFSKLLDDSSVVVVGDGQILRIGDDGLPIGTSGSLLYLNSSHPSLSSFSDVRFLDVIKMSSTSMKVLGCYKRYFGSSSRIQIFSFDSSSNIDQAEVTLSRFKDHTLLEYNENIEKAVFDEWQNIVFSCSLGTSRRISIQDYSNLSKHTTVLNDGSYRKTVSAFSNVAYYVPDFIVEPDRLVVLSGHVVQALSYPDDSDGDGLWDSTESLYQTHVQSSDSDADGLSDWEELVIWDLDPLNQDSDGDGIPDGFEVNGLAVKAAAIVTLGSLAQTYDGTPKAAAATTDPAGKTVSFTYDGSATAPTNAGSYAVVGTINDPYYHGFASGLMTIAAAPQAITFTVIPDKLTTDTVTLSATGGGSGNPVTFAVTGGPASITNGVMSFSGAGSVTVTASQTGNANYEAAPDVPRTFNVTKATATVTLGNLSQTYDGTPKSATATTDPAGKTVVFTYEGSATAPTNAGSYAVVGTIDDAIYQGSANGTLVIAKAAQTVTFGAIPDKLTTDTVTLTATGGDSGNPVTFAVTEGPASITDGVLGFTGAGSVTITASQAGNANYEAAPEVSRTFTVTKATATVTLSRLHQVADGTAREVVVTTVPPALAIIITYAGSPTPPLAVGSYPVTATVDDPLYEGSASGTLVVDDPARSVRVAGGSLPALSAIGDLSVPTFSIGAYEVTGSQWAAVVAWAEANAGYDFAGAGSAASGDRPVTGISWFDAAKWCNARTEWENTLLGKSLAPAYRVAGVVYKTGTPTSPADLTCDFGAGGYRLPTAAEWEYAARGGASGTPSTYPGGNTLDELGWYDGNSNEAVQPAGGKTANGLDLYDLAGNAAEWTWDAPAGSPDQRLLRGGAWSSAASACELTALAGETPALRLDRSGFRLARSISLALAAALDAPGLDWESGGDEAWFAQTGTTHDGIDAAESGAVAPGQSSWLETTVTGPCNLRFRWEAAQRAALDVFRLETGTGDPILLTGPGDWEERLVELPAGAHTLRWVFARDAASTGASRVRLDEASVTPATPPTVTTAAASEVSGSGATLGGEVTADGGRTVTARGVVYSTTPEPTTTSATVLTDASAGTGTYSITATGLSEGTTYFARAYATNNLGTAYGTEIVFTTDTNVVFVEGLAVLERGIRPGDTHRFLFILGGPRVFAYATTGAGGLEVSLHDAAGVMLRSHASPWDLDEDVVLEPGSYELRVRRPAGGTPTPQQFSLTLDERTTAVVRPDAMVGGSLAFLGGADVYDGPLTQQLRLRSPKARPVSAYAAVANRGNRPDRFAWRGNGDSRYFRVEYRDDAGALVTAAVRAGLHRTPERQPEDPSDWLRVSVTPDRRLLVVKKNGRTVTLRKVHTVLLDASSVVDPSIGDGVSIRVETR